MATTEINIGVPVTGTFTAQVVDVPAISPANVVRASDEFRVDCSWFIEGGLASSLGGTWYVQVEFEALGPGAEFREKEVGIALDGRTGSATPYTHSFDFPAGPTFPNGLDKVAPGERNEVYRISVTLAYADVAGKNGPMGTFVSLDELMIYG